MNKEEVFKEEMKGFNISIDNIEPSNDIFGAIEKTIIKMKEEIERLNNIIDELEKTFVNDDKRIKEYNIEHPERPLDNYSRHYLDKLKELKEGK